MDTDETKKLVVLQNLIPLSSACILSICGLISPSDRLFKRTVLGGSLAAIVKVL